MRSQFTTGLVLSLVSVLCQAQNGASSTTATALDPLSTSAAAAAFRARVMECVQPCGTGSAIDMYCGGVNDNALQLQCFCSSTPFENVISACLSKTCPSDAPSLIATLHNGCNDVVVSPPDSPPAKTAAGDDDSAGSKGSAAPPPAGAAPAPAPAEKDGKSGASSLHAGGASLLFLIGALARAVMA